jgi:hypothetical protein
MNVFEKVGLVIFIATIVANPWDSGLSSNVIHLILVAGAAFFIFMGDRK